MRSKTRSDVKWLINQAAMLAGELEQIDVEMERLVTRRAEVERSHAACLQTLNLIVEPSPSTEVALPIIRAHRQYGGRGRLRRFLLDELQAAAPAALDTNELSIRATKEFGLTFSAPTELADFKNNTVGRALRYLQDIGSIERVGKRRAGRAAGAWRWRREALLEEIFLGTQRGEAT